MAKENLRPTGLVHLAAMEKIVVAEKERILVKRVLTERHAHSNQEKNTSQEASSNPGKMTGRGMIVSQEG
jgi:hypothetical protein